MRRDFCFRVEAEAPMGTGGECGSLPLRRHMGPLGTSLGGPHLNQRPQDFGVAVVDSEVGAAHDGPARIRA